MIVAGQSSEGFRTGGKHHAGGAINYGFFIF
jgi:hypothetical protein